MKKRDLANALLKRQLESGYHSGLARDALRNIKAMR
jgi:hypothetical protein